MYQMHSTQPECTQQEGIDVSEALSKSFGFRIAIEGDLGYKHPIYPGESGNDENWYRCISEDQIIPNAFALPSNRGSIEVVRPMFEKFRREVNTSLEGRCFKLRWTIKLMRWVTLAFLCFTPISWVLLQSVTFNLKKNCDFSEKQNICHRLGVVGVIIFLSCYPVVMILIFLVVRYPLVHYIRLV